MLRKRYIITALIAAALIFLYWLIGFSAIIIRESDRVSIADSQLTISRTVNIYTLLSGFLMPVIVLSIPLLALLFVKLYKKYDIKLFGFDEHKIKKLTAPLYIIIIFVLLPLRFTIWEHLFNTMFLLRLIAALIIAVHIISALRTEKPDYINFMTVLFILTGLSKTLNNLAKSFRDMSLVADFEYTDGAEITALFFFRSLINDFHIDMMPLYFSMMIVLLLYAFGKKIRYLN